MHQLGCSLPASQPAPNGTHHFCITGITPRVIRHLFTIAEALNKKAKPGEKVEVRTESLKHCSATSKGSGPHAMLHFPMPLYWSLTLPHCVVVFRLQQISAYALELYNEDLLDLSKSSGRDDANKARASSLA